KQREKGGHSLVQRGQRAEVLRKPLPFAEQAAKDPGEFGGPFAGQLKDALLGQQGIEVLRSGGQLGQRLTRGAQDDEERGEIVLHDLQVRRAQKISAQRLEVVLDARS